MSRTSVHFQIVLALVLVGCGGGGGTGPTAVVSCEESQSVDLSVGGHLILDAAGSGGCLEFAAGSSEREYIVVPFSAVGQESENGTEGPFKLTTFPISAAPEGSATIRVEGNTPDANLDFHVRLRQQIGEFLDTNSAAKLSSDGLVRRPPTQVGDQDEFNVCSTLECKNFVSVTATAKYVGTEGVVWLDDDLPTTASPLTQADLEYLGELFDDHLFPIDTTAFGGISDIDSDGQVAILITDQVNKLSTDCTNGRIVGFFFGGDLIPSFPGSNKREIFFAHAPAPSAGNCPAITRSRALKSLPAVLIHELQHMISFNQRTIKRGRGDESLWLSEGLSHFAEELGQRLVPESECTQSISCESLFGSGNLTNAYSFLREPQAIPLVAPNSGVSLSGRGAAWLFVRWAADHFGDNGVLGTSFTRAVQQNAFTGAANIASVSGVSFTELDGEWLLANWLDNLPGFPQAGRLNYLSWNFRDVFKTGAPNFPAGYPLVPSSTSGSTTLAGTLRAGSGAYVRIIVPAGSTGIDAKLTGSNGTAPVSSQLSPHFAVARIR